MHIEFWLAWFDTDSFASSIYRTEIAWMGWSSFEEIEMFKVLTIKSNKIPENKKVKGKDNIFAGNSGAAMFDKGLKAPPKKKEVQEKTEE